MRADCLRDRRLGGALALVLLALIAGSMVVSGATLGVSSASGVPRAGISASVLPDPAPPIVVFTETGLPAGTNWSVTFNSVTEHSTTSAIQFVGSPGIYPFTVGTVSGYSPTPARGNVSVASGTVTTPISFQSASSGSSPTLLGLPTFETVSFIAIAAVVVLLLIGGLLSCPDNCTPKGKKANCGPHVYIDTVPCGETPDWANDLQTGTEIIALGSEIAKKIEIVGEAYAKILESIPGWIPAIKKVNEGKVGFEAYARVVCSWSVCSEVWCVWPPWKWHLDWTREGRYYGPYKLTPPAGYQGGQGGDCFKPGMELGQMYEGLQKAVENNEKVQEAKRKCTEDCAK